jgi:signal transduction histidine kinase
VSALAYAGWMAALWLACGASWFRVRLARHAELVADAGHELRGPLCAARLGLHGLDDAERAAAVDLELRRATLALEDLVAASRGRRAGARPELVDVGALLDDGAEAWRPLAAAFGASLSVEPLRGRALVRADPVRLAQACGNLVANAVEHGASPVRVRGRVVAGRVRVEVIDSGSGLPEPVSRLVARRRRGAARGRGLAIAARIAAAHGGRLSSAPSSRGARLVLELPSADLWPEPFPPPGGAQRASAPPSREPGQFPGAPRALAPLPADPGRFPSGPDQWR